MNNNFKFNLIKDRNFIKNNSTEFNFAPTLEEDEDFGKLINKKIDIKKFLFIHKDIALKVCVYGLHETIYFKDNEVCNIIGNLDQSIDVGEYGNESHCAFSQFEQIYKNQKHIEFYIYDEK